MEMRRLLLLVLPPLLVALQASQAWAVQPVPGGKYLVVGNTVPWRGITWNFNLFNNYTQWSVNTKQYVGDVAVFKYPKYYDAVVVFGRKLDWLVCNYFKSVTVCSDTAGSGFGCGVLLTNRPMYLASATYGRCRAGQKVMLLGQQKQYVPKNIIVGAPMPGHNYPWNQAVNYATWLSQQKIYIGDTLVFRYAAMMDEVYVVPTLQDYNTCYYNNWVSWCNATDGIGNGCYTNPLTAGTQYFVSGVYSHCMAGQRIAVTPMAPIL